MNRKLIVVTAPSGAGKTTIVKHLLDNINDLAFSVSATTRNKRPDEVEGVDYYFMNVSSFQTLINEDAFVEWEQVYEHQYYGTLKKEVERLWALGKYIIFDIDVKGAINIKKIYKDKVLTIFVKPPNKEILINRLKNRKTENPESLKARITKAEVELLYEDKFDYVLINDDLTKAFKEAEKVVFKFLIG